MMIETTMNLTTDVRNALDKAVEDTGMKRSIIITHLMRRVLGEYGKISQFNSRIKYQGRDTNGKWRRTHMVIPGRDYEIFLDMRKLFKRSVSLLVAYAVERYLSVLRDVIMDEEYDEDADNYPFRNYIIIQKLIDNIICWQIYWGMPRKKHLRHLLQS